MSRFQIRCSDPTVRCCSPGEALSHVLTVGDQDFTKMDTCFAFLKFQSTFSLRELPIGWKWIQN